MVIYEIANLRKANITMSGIYISESGIPVKDCPKCKMTKPIFEYAKHAKEKSGLRSRCKVCQSEYNISYASEVRDGIREPFTGILDSDALMYTVQNDPNKRATANRKLVRDMKNNPCVDCGNTYAYYNMDFDHIPGTVKLFNISEGIQKPTDILLAEIAKCELVCKLCHGDRSHTRGWSKGRPKKS